MGEYYDIMNFDKKRYMQLPQHASKFHNFYNDDEYNIALANLIYKEWKGDHIGIVGDYAGSYSKEPKTVVEKFINNICDRYKFDKGHVQGWADNMYDMSGLDNLDEDNLDERMYVNGNKENIHKLRYAYNHKLKQYVDFEKYSIENPTCVASPLVMLLAIGSASEYNYDKTGIWADTSEFITVESKKLDNNYEEITYWIK